MQGSRLKASVEGTQAIAVWTPDTSGDYVLDAFTKIKKADLVKLALENTDRMSFKGNDVIITMPLTPEQAEHYANSIIHIGCNFIEELQEVSEN